MEVIQQLETWALQVANPALAAGQRATSGWPVMSLAAALQWCGVYAVIVVVGLIRRSSATEVVGKNGKPTTDGSNPLLPDALVKPFQFLYNAVQVVLCGWMMTAALVEAQKAGVAVSPSTIVCNRFDANAKGIAFVLWVFYLSKILDFLDTVFMVLRAKWSQLSFLHVYHHFSIFLTYWLVTSVGYDGDVYYTVVANSFVHLVMYFYYLLSTVGYSPAWGKHLTQMQMAQFVTMNAQAITILAGGCAYPHAVTWFYLAYILSLLGLFASFYVKRWASGGDKKEKKAE